MHSFYFEKLDVFNNLRKHVVKVYQVTNNFPSSENYGLTSQLRRAVVSAMVNLAEGSRRVTKKDQAHFTTIAFSSLMEALAILMISLDQNYLIESDYIMLRKEMTLITSQLNALKRAQLTRLERLKEHQTNQFQLAK